MRGPKSAAVVKQCAQLHVAPIGRHPRRLFTMPAIAIVPSHLPILSHFCEERTGAGDVRSPQVEKFGGGGDKARELGLFADRVIGGPHCGIIKCSIVGRNS